MSNEKPRSEIRHPSCFQRKRAERVGTEMRMVGPVRQSWRGFDGNVEVVTQKNLLERRAPPESPHMASRSMIWRDPPRFPKWHARCTTDRRICIGSDRADRVWFRPDRFQVQ